MPALGRGRVAPALIDADHGSCRDLHTRCEYDRQSNAETAPLKLLTWYLMHDVLDELHEDTHHQLVRRYNILNPTCYMRGRHCSDSSRARRSATRLVQIVRNIVHTLSVSVGRNVVASFLYMWIRKRTSFAAYVTRSFGRGRRSHTCRCSRLQLLLSLTCIYFRRQLPDGKIHHRCIRQQQP